MTGSVRNFTGWLRRGMRPAVFGAFVGLFSACVISSIVLPAIPVRAQVQMDPTSTAGQDKFCFTAVECKKEMAGKSQCQSNDGCCIDDRCFVPGQGCKSKGSSAGGNMGLCYAKSPPIDLKVSFGDTTRVMDIGDYLEKAYKYAVGIAGFLAAIMMMIGGFMYLTAGDSGRSSKGKAYITDAIIGLAVALGAWLMLNTVNPDLVSLQLPKVPVVKKTAFVGCDLTKFCHGCGEEYTVYVDNEGNPPPSGDCTWTSSKTKPNTNGVYEGSTCRGQSCLISAKDAGADTAGCSPNQTRCRISGSASSGLGGDTGEAIDQAVAQSDAAQAGACGVDTETTGYVCGKCVKDGEVCMQEGPTEICCSGFCGDNKCSSGQPGDWCDDDKSCVSGICQEDGWASCSSGLVGSPCDGGEDCPELKCQDSDVFDYCAPGNRYSKCGVDDDCQTGLVCSPGRKVCIEPGGSLYECKSSADCLQYGLKYCTTSWFSSTCTDGSPGAPCGVDDTECAALVGTYPNGVRYRGMCVAKINMCTNGDEGVPCDDGYDCRSGRCGTTPKDTVCVSGRVGSRCGDKNVNGVSPCDEGLVCSGSGDYKTCNYPAN